MKTFTSEVKEITVNSPPHGITIVLENLDILYSIMKKKREELKKEFLSLTPLQRIRLMNALFNDIISFKAKTSGKTEYEVYRRYLKPRK